jgi:hypothetical protein
MTVRETTIGVAEHQPIGNGVEPGCGSGLGDTVARGRTKRSK